MGTNQQDDTPVVILAGGYGTRISEETDRKPKPMVEIGGRPIIWHIMKYYSHYGFDDFIILLGYKGYYIKEYFANYFLHQSDVTIELSTNKLEVHNSTSEPWRVTLLDTAIDTMTGGRILRARPYIRNRRFMLTYGDGVSNVDLNSLLKFHKSHKKAVTLTAVQVEGQYGSIDPSEEGRILRFMEKPKGDESWINGGFFVCQPRVFDYLTEGEATVFERGPLEKLASDGELYAYKHSGFWKCMDTLRDKISLNKMWEQNQAEWKVWE
jgi:glucose-1-phosphate cytidylyltransferase